METVVSADGTRIAFERLGEGPPVVVVGGATCDRTVTRPLAERLARRFTVINYDRRGRGDSGDTTPYAVEREVEDIAALIVAAGGTAFVYGHSSGAALALHAAARGLPVGRLVLHEPPFSPGGERGRVMRETADEVGKLLAEDRRDDALALHLSMTGMPPEAVREMRHRSWWAGWAAKAVTLPYDYAVLDEAGRGGVTPAEQARGVSAPTLVVCGGASPAWLLDEDRRVADALPDGRYVLLAGQEHVVPPEVLVPVLAEFFAG
ncbi:alpha/beta fold hydrolase [Streptosporangium sp. NPDC004379]|uniref:alpha/beta fold hydrolase n=1 Tax=Streptosporangium sp. NPDC004379 TaxID=3366189 RepID=UPI0036ADC9FB